jgi:hypothetical protein
LYSFKVPIADFHAKVKKAERVLAQMPKDLQRIAEKWAATERATHKYVNRTRTLEPSTVGKVVRVTRDRLEAVLQMGEPDAPYAIFVVRRGLSTIDLCGQRMISEVNEYVRRLSGRVARGR